MFTQTDLNALTNVEDDAVKVSIFVPTAISGPETRQGRIVLKNALAKARALLDERGLDKPAAEELLAPAEAMLEDSDFWQHRSAGLAIFLAVGFPPRHFTVPIPLADDVVVDEAFSVGPLLPLLAADGAFTIVTVTANRVRLFEASRFALHEVHDSGLPLSLQDSMGESDYENPLQASPVARPHTAAVSISNAQVYGDSPAEYQDAQSREFASRLATALAKYRAANPRPTVLLAGTEYVGLLTPTDAVDESVDINPEALDDSRIHELAYEKVRTVLDADRARAVDEFAMLQGREDARAIVGAAQVAGASAEGRVGTLLYRPQDSDADAPAEDRRLTDTAIVETLRNGGTVFALDDQSTIDETVGAILRY